MVADYIIVGQGLCGTFLSWNLIQQGCTVLVIDEPQTSSSSKVASGVINPITGRRMVKTWMIDELLPFAWAQYQQLGNELGVSLVKKCSVVQFHTTPQMRDAFTERLAEDETYLQVEDNSTWEPYFRFNYGAAAITPCLHIEVNAMLSAWRNVLKSKGALLEEHFDLDQLLYNETGVQYKNISASKIIFCNGTDAYDMPFFNKLPFARNKGEALIVDIPGLPATDIYKHGFTIVPWSDGLFWVGSTYEWDFTSLEPTPLFRKKVEEHLGYWLKLPFSVVAHLSAERPATLERRPFVGIHPLHPAIGILNGTGTKGCSLAPYFAQEFSRFLVDGQPITPQADVARFQKVLSR